LAVVVPRLHAQEIADLKARLARTDDLQRELQVPSPP